MCPTFYWPIGPRASWKSTAVHVPLSQYAYPLLPYLIAWHFTAVQATLKDPAMCFTWRKKHTRIAGTKLHLIIYALPGFDPNHPRFFFIFTFYFILHRYIHLAFLTYQSLFIRTISCVFLCKEDRGVWARSCVTCVHTPTFHSCSQYLGLNMFETIL